MYYVRRTTPAGVEIDFCAALVNDERLTNPYIIEEGRADWRLPR